jgi:ABC-2 type transport system ATP-binding protein/lipopolysaccharide transport system ATP-binding protein
MTHLTLEGVTVDIPIYGASDRNIKGSIMRAIKRRPDDTVWVRALEHIDLEVHRGERLGLIGPNGAGKTTLLRVMAGILEPSLGDVEVQGAVAAMFDLGLGIEAEATGVENILVRGMLLGHSRKEMRERVEAIAEFSGLGDRIAHPVRTYSTGMRARLAFSIVTAIHPEILLIDEGIGTADAAFTAKAEARLGEFVDRAGIVILASHADGLLRKFCTQGVVIERGRLLFHAGIEEALAFYQTMLQQPEAAT